MLGGLESWSREILGAPVPSESKASCHQCAMIPAADHPVAPSAGVWFSPDVRCCTYEPALPNYLVGRVLRDARPELAAGRASMRTRLQQLDAVAPAGVRHSGRFLALYQGGRELFGRAPDLRCPHLLPGNAGCGIWYHRGAVCATWHCKHERGELGAQLWRALRIVAQEIEFVLSLWCARTLAIPTAGLQELLDGPSSRVQASELGGSSDLTAYAARWGSWRGREVEFFERCAALVDPLDWSDVERLGGERLAALVQRVREARAALDAPIPAALTMAPLTLELAPDGRMTLQTYSSFDPVRATPELVQILPRFRGASTTDTLAAIAEQDHVTVTEPLVQRLIDFRILRPADPAPTR